DVAVTVDSPVASSVYGQAVTFTAHVSPASGTATPTGTVTFTDAVSGIVLGSATLSGGTATTPQILTVPAGTHTIKGTYNGDGNFNTGSANASGTLTVSPASIDIHIPTLPA